MRLPSLSFLQLRHVLGRFDFFDMNESPFGFVGKISELISQVLSKLIRSDNTVIIRMIETYSRKSFRIPHLRL